MLISSANDIGEVPTSIIEAAKTRKGHKRSASITRVFTGIRRMVGRGTSPPKIGDVSDEVEEKHPVKRKSQEILPPTVTVKRRREMADTTPQMCRMRGYSQCVQFSTSKSLIEACIVTLTLPPTPMTNRV